jgi:hypothetical protein
MSITRVHATLLAASFVLFAGCAAPSQGTFSDGGDDEAAAPGDALVAAIDDADALDDFDIVLGDWQVTDGTARQSGAFANPDFPRIVRRNLVFTDVDLGTHCKAESGLIDQVCGLMFHVVDSDNYLLVRSNALEGNIRLYHVVDGVRTETASVNHDVTAGEYHDLALSTRGASVTVTWDGDVVLEGEEGTFASGHVGLWTKADSVTSYDTLNAEEL